MKKSLEDIITELVELFRPYIEGVDSVIDIGTGTSIPIHIFAEKYPDVRYHTVDVTDIRKRKDLPFVLYDGRRLPFGDSEFDVAILNETLHHCEDPEPVLKEARRVANLLYVIEHFPDPGSDINELFKSEMDALQNFDMHFGLYKPFTEDSLYSLFDTAGLSVRDRFEIPYYGSRTIRKYFFRLG